jgi:hypothetical protein
LKFIIITIDDLTNTIYNHTERYKNIGAPFWTIVYISVVIRTWEKYIGHRSEYSI